MVEDEFGPVEAARIRDLMPEEHDDGAPYNQNALTFYAARRED